MRTLTSLHARARQSRFVHGTALAVVSALVGLSIGVVVSGNVIDTSGSTTNGMSHRSSPTKPVAIPRAKHDTAIPPVVNGVAPLVTHLDTKQPVVFLTIDDGGSLGVDYLAYLKQKRLVGSLFLADAFIAGHYDYFMPYTRAGFVVENHTVSHDLRLYRRQGEYVRHEICGMSDIIEREYGARPKLYRAPGGASTPYMQMVAASCGMRAVVGWKAKVDGGAVQYQEGTVLKPGDIVLMHFRPDFKADIDAFVAAMQAAGLHTERLEDWL